MTENSVELRKTEDFHRLPRETDKAWGAFCVYRNLGEARTFPEAYRRYCQKSGRQPNRNVPTHWYAWADRYDWASRVRAYDNEIEREALELAKQRMTESREQSVQMIMTMQAGIESLIQGWDGTQPDARELSLATNAAIALIRERERLLGLAKDEKEVGDPSVLDVHWHVHRR